MVKKTKKLCLVIFLPYIFVGCANNSDSNNDSSINKINGSVNSYSIYLSEKKDEIFFTGTMSSYYDFAKDMGFHEDLEFWKTYVNGVYNNYYNTLYGSNSKDSKKLIILQNAVYMNIIIKKIILSQHLGVDSFSKVTQIDDNYIQSIFSKSFIAAKQLGFNDSRSDWDDLLTNRIANFDAFLADKPDKNSLVLAFGAINSLQLHDLVGTNLGGLDPDMKQNKF